MAIKLNENERVAKKTYSGSDAFTVLAGEELKIEIAPQGDEILDVEVPEGKVWRVSISLVIDEVDA